eukprot:1664383-Pyramimonas_sp.AAC.1
MGEEHGQGDEEEEGEGAQEEEEEEEEEEGGRRTAHGKMKDEEGRTRKEDQEGEEDGKEGGGERGLMKMIGNACDGFIPDKLKDNGPLLITDCACSFMMASMLASAHWPTCNFKATS